MLLLYDYFTPFEEIEEAVTARITKHVTIENVIVEKVFSSLSRPCLIQLERMIDGAKLDRLSYDDVTSFDKAPLAILIKKGNNLVQDHCAAVMFRVFNFVWRRSNRYAETDILPYCFSYKVVSTNVQQRFKECVSNVDSLRDLDWKAWYLISA